MTTAVTSSTSSSSTTSSSSGTASTSSTTNATSDRFLKLLVAQLQNQDPLNPTDNAQVTQQMAQIQTVQGIGDLNDTVKSLSAQFSQLQALSGAALVGRDVLVEGSKMRVDSEGVGHAGFELDKPTDRTTVEVLNAGGAVIDTVQMGALGSGRHVFDWTPSKGVDATQAATFRVKATSGTTEVKPTLLQTDRVDAVSSDTTGLVLELEGAGPVAYDKIKAFN